MTIIAIVLQQAAFLISVELDAANVSVFHLVS